jgi:hypothetical protein
MVAPMVRKLWVAALAALVLSAQGCARKPSQSGAADTAQALLTAAWTGDAKGFEAAIDRPAVRADLRRQLMQVAQANTLSVEGGASDAALDRMITPDSFRMVEANTGQPLPAAPSRGQAGALLKPLAKDRACVTAQAPDPTCLLTFAKEKGGWRLVGMAPAGFTIAVSPEPAPDRKGS